MMTIKINPRHDTINGAYKLLDFKVKALKNSYGTGKTWYICFENGYKYNTLMSASGKDSYRKRDFEVMYK